MDFALYFIILFFYDKIEITSTKNTAPVTPPLSDRLELLRFQISNQLQQKDVVLENDRVALNENIDYVDIKLPFRPIDEHDPRKKHEKFKLRGLKTTNAHAFPNLRNDIADKPLNVTHSSKKPREQKKMPQSKITDVFYKRAFGVQLTEHWIHCQDMITPFLTGKKDLKVKNLMEYNDTLVLRFVQLLKVEITDQHTVDDIHSILYQISNLPIRLFQWDVSAMKLLINIISTGSTTGNHSFRSIKTGLKLIFQKWNLAVGSDNAMLLKQTRLFRPPCIDVSGREGSTLTPKIVRYTKPEKKAKKVCPENASDEDCEE